MISTDEYVKFQNYQDSLQASSSSTPVASTVALGSCDEYVDDIVITRNDASGISSLKNFFQGKLGAKPSGTPMMPNQQLVQEGKLLDHWVVVEQILRCLKAVLRRGILYKDHGHTRVECFSNDDCAGSRKDRRSTSGYCVFVGGNLVSWKRYVKTREQLGDILTKAVNGARISYLCNKLSMIKIFASA
ncbi:putative mitochondrial protein [Cucumis melo var. makuwa]|uniref:Mitochondrial protein n=1 Tax=Cucumis melo var. makuwa TaxID=1194695 RepID=A0A5A7UJU5_CUCMM|nr:putative mitochondrial protein [Cucumis melo var. makuwa]TYJ96588.1 putative mitochondrial protein [Cucumis melo var. makuwa]